MRRLILISSPGREEEGNYQPTTTDVINKFEHYFRSNIGGSWEDGEIDIYGENRPLSVREMHRLHDEVRANIGRQTPQFRIIGDNNVEGFPFAAIRSLRWV